MFGELISETVIIQNLVKCVKHPLDTEDSEFNACMNIADKVLMVPI